MISGLDVDIMKEFCKLTGLKLRLVERNDFNGIWFDPIRKLSDVSIGGIGITDKRTKPGMQWSIPYFYVFRTVVFNKANPIRKFPESITYDVRGTPGSTGYIDAEARLDAYGNRNLLKKGKTDQQDIQDLKDGKIQGLMRGSFVGKALLLRHKEFGMVKPWQIDEDLVASDGEVFAYPTLCTSGVGQLLSVLITEDIFNGEMQHLIQKYKLI